MCNLIPLSSFKKQTINITTILRFLMNILNLKLIHKQKVKINLIHSNCIFSSIILHNSSNKSLREKETRNPIVIWSTICYPIIYKIYTSINIINPWRKWFQWIKGFFLPCYWNCITIKSIGYLFKIIWHNNKSFKCSI